MKSINDIRNEKELYYVLPNNVRSGREDLTQIRAVVVACLYYEELLAESLNYLSNVPEYIDICICTSNPVIVDKTGDFCRQRNNAFILQKNNRGRDISSLLVACREILPRYEYICFIHDKKSIHALTQQRWEIDLWIKNLWSSVLDSEQYIGNVLEVFAQNPNIGLLVPPEPTGDIMRNWYNNTWGPNFENTVELSERLNLKCNISLSKPPFTIGTVFWCRYDALKKLFAYDWHYEDFPEEPMAIDGTISHAIERVIGYVAQDAGYDTGTILTTDYAEYLISFAQNRLQDTFNVIEKTYGLYDFNQVRLCKKAQRKYTDRVIKGVKCFAQQHRKLYIYGAGIWAERIVEIIDEEGLDLAGIFVTNPEENPLYVGSHRCGVLGTISDCNAGIIIAVRNSQAVKEIEKIIDSQGVFDYISINELETGKAEERWGRKSVSNSVKFSILMPVYNVEPIYLSRALKSVLNQSYKNWELCIADDCSTDERVIKYLYNVHDDRIKIRMQKKNGGISAATNAAAEMATGDYLLLMDNDDWLYPNALLTFYNEIKKSDPDIIYSDMDKINEEEAHSGEFYKPDWSPDLMTAQMYVGHLLGFRKSLFDQVGGFRTECDGSQDYDIVLRMSEVAKKISHVDGILYSWRLLPSSAALNGAAKPYTQTAALRAIQEYLNKKYGVGYAVVNETEWLHVYDITYDLPEDTKISVIVPMIFMDDVALTQIYKIQSECAMKGVELLLVGDVPEQLSGEYIVGVPTAKTTWAGMCNDGVMKARGDVIIILDGHADLMTVDWDRRLASNVLRKEIGVAGGLVLNNMGLIENAGTRIDRNGWIYDMYAGMEPIQQGEPTISPLMTRNVTAVSHKCMAFSKTVYTKLNGFDEESMSSSVDFCVAAIKNGWRNIYLPLVKIQDRGEVIHNGICSVDMGNQMYLNYLADGDPYYNNLLDETEKVPTIKR